MKNDEEYFRSLVLSIPPMDPRDFTSLKSDLMKIPGYKEGIVEEVTSRACPVPGNANHPLVGSLSKALNESHEIYRSKNITSRFSLENDENDPNCLIIRTFAEQIDPHNWTTGYWSTTWTLTPDDSLRGTASIHVYNFEEGSNVQMRASREYPEESVHGDDLAKSIVGRIVDSDKKLLGDLSDEEAVLTSLKNIRRILPITRTRMKWDDSAQRQVRLLNERKTA